MSTTNSIQKRHFANWQGVQTEAPPDLKETIYELHGGFIVWSRQRYAGQRAYRHRVRYGLQYTDFGDDLSAIEDLGHCMRHFAECEGLLDGEPKGF